MRLRSMVLATTTLIVLSMAAPAVAVHEDVISEPIASSPVSVDLELVADGFTTPLWATSPQGDRHRLFVVDQNGTVVALDIGGSEKVPDRLLFLDIGVTGQDLLVPLGAFGPGTFDERGLLGLAFHPDYRRNGLVYTYSSEPVAAPADFSTLGDGEVANHQGVLREWKVKNPRNPESVVDPASTRVLLRIDEPQFNHNAGAIVFGRDGKLYVAVGDGGSADDQGAGHVDGGNGQSLAEGNVLGKILRIDPRGENSANGNYGIPRSNPFVGKPGADEIYAYGFRNPFRISVDQRTGRIYVADVGQNDIEEVNILRKGANYGWPVKEGSFLFNMNGDEPGFTTVQEKVKGLVDPIAEYDHDEGISITGGFVYRGRDIKRLRGSYVFGDFSNGFAPANGRLFHLGKGKTILELVPGSGSLGRYLMGFGQDAAGEIYVLTSDNFAPAGTGGTVHKLVAGNPG
ncbi:MAG: PQQ-dependent sugar dehydrogenase [Acidimicrobiia bacterium]|nr:PQQ-dependent sugar dehydrogenase [Acidimicrobiia bacterium]MDH4306134.1 PQQ-dependent sugar dehydrogenase [Acidimicrobiia bacterium]MDH5292125.1 PQQ-dependent sugar dehydrogenase [Acidimicrobiia bacterium]